MTRRHNYSALYPRTLFDEYEQKPLFETSQEKLNILPQKAVGIIHFTDYLLDMLKVDFAKIHEISDEQFEQILCTLLDRMGYNAFRPTGGSRHRDGGIDIYATPRVCPTFPLFLAIQAKHHRFQDRTVGVQEVREFRDVVSHNQIVTAGILITNTKFTASAKFLSDQEPSLVKLRDCHHLARWISGNFIHEQDWREVPQRIEVCPNFYVEVPRPFYKEDEQKGLWIA